MEEDPVQPDLQGPSQEEASRKAEQPPAQAPPHASAPASPSSLDQEEALTKAQEKGLSACQAQSKLLWKPIPPLLPEAHAKTKDQSSQTEEPSSTPGQGHNTGGKMLNADCPFFPPDIEDIPVIQE